MKRSLSYEPEVEHNFWFLLSLVCFLVCVCVNAFGCIWVFWLEYSQALCQTFFPFASLLLGSAFFPKVLT